MEIEGELTSRQQEIVNVAIELIAAGGVQNLTIKKIAKGVGVTEAALYRHFSSKEEILNAIVRRFETETDHALSEGSSRGFFCLKTYVETRFRRVASCPVLAHVVFSEEMFADSPERLDALISMKRRRRQKIMNAFQEAKDQGAIRNDISNEMLFTLAIGPVRLLVKMWAQSGYAFNLVEKGEELWDSLVKTLSPIISDNAKDSNV